MTDYEPEEDAADWSEEDIPPQFREEFPEPSEGKKLCPSCRNEIPEDAIRCLFCGRHVPVDSGFLNLFNRYPFRAIALVGALLGLVSVLAWVLL